MKHPDFPCFEVETIDRIQSEVNMMTTNILKSKRELMTKYRYMNSPCDNVELHFIEQRLIDIGRVGGTV